MWQTPVGVHSNDRGPLPSRRVTICPGLLGGVETPMTAHFKVDASQWQQYIDSHPIGRVGTPEDIVHLAVYLASDESSWVTGSIFTIDGGRTAM